MTSQTKALEESILAVNIPSPSRILLPDVNESVPADQEGAFFSVLHQSDGTTRMTSGNRLNDLNAAIASYLPADDRVKALDVGISSGISTLEWLLSLEAIGRICTMTACDRVLNARLLQFAVLQVLAEKNGHLLLVHNGRRAFTRPTHQTSSWRNAVVRTVFWFGDLIVRLALASGFGRQVRLVTHRLQSRSDVIFVEHDIFCSAPEWGGRFHLVRVANLLNRSYFSEEVLRTGLRNAGDWLQIGGLLVVTRTESGGQNNATIFRKELSGFRVLHRLGVGSEVETLVMPVVQ